MQSVLLAVVVPLAAVVVNAAARWLRAKTAALLNGIDANWRYAIEEAAQLAVDAAEQSALAGLIGAAAEEKKRFACDFAERYLAQFNIRVDLDVIADLIEVEVRRQFGKPAANEDGVHALGD